MSDEPKECPSGSGTIHGYSVEARYASHSPLVLGDLILDERWRHVSFPKGHPGVPIGPSYHASFLSRCGLMSYPAAQALRWWLHAEGDASSIGCLCLETRIVKHKVRYSYGVTRESVHCTVGGDDRSNCIPDWGTKEPAAKAAE